MLMQVKKVRVKIKGMTYNYIQKVVKRFNMRNLKPASTPFAIHFKLSTKQCT